MALKQQYITISLHIGNRACMQLPPRLLTSLVTAHAIAFQFSWDSLYLRRVLYVTTHLAGHHDQVHPGVGSGAGAVAGGGGDGGGGGLGGEAGGGGGGGGGGDGGGGVGAGVGGAEGGGCGWRKGEGGGQLLIP